MWHLYIFPHKCHVSIIDSTTCLPSRCDTCTYHVIPLPHVIWTLPHHPMPRVTLVVVPRATLDSSTYQLSSPVNNMPHQSATVPVTSLYSRMACIVICHVSTVRIVQSSNFAYLTKRTDRDIFLIRCLFDTIQVALGSYRRCLCTCLF
jgi:hypothetical protein